MNKKKSRGFLAVICIICVLLLNNLPMVTVALADEENVYYHGEENYNWYTYNKGSTAFQNFALITSDGKNETKQIAYCFNGAKAHPSNAKKGYTKSYNNATAEQFGKLVQNGKTPFNNNVEEMQKMIKKCVYFGYPYNKSNNNYYEQALNKTGGDALLARDMLRAATQYCIWDATDYKQAFSWTFNTAKARKDLVTALYEKEALDLGAKIYTEAWKTRLESNAYELELDLYSPIGYSEAQNLLAVRLPDNEAPHHKDTPLKESVNVSGTKTWSGDREESRPANIDVRLKQKVRNQVTDTGQVRTADKANGWSYSFTDLPKHNKQGELIEYFVEEDVIPVGYKPVYSHEKNNSSYDICNEYQKAPASLTLEKKVTGDMGDLSSKYTFNLELKEKNGKKVNGTYPVVSGVMDGIENVKAPNTSEISFVDGKAVVELSHGQKVRINNLSEGYICKITENVENQKGCITRYNGKATEGIEVALKKDIVVTVENNKEFVPPTGITNYPNSMFISMGAIVLMLFMLVFTMKIYKRGVFEKWSTEKKKK